MVNSTTGVQWGANESSVDQGQASSNNQFGSSASAGSVQRRKTTKEKVQSAFSIQNDFQNRNITNKPDSDEFFNFIIFMIIIPVINFLVMVIAASVRDASI